MRYAVVSDVHANVPALEAAVEALERERPDAWLCLGDVVGYGPQPNECARRIRELAAACVAGNHDLMALGRLRDRGSPVALAVMRWTRGALDGDVRAWLATLPLTATAAGGVVAAHGSLDDPDEPVMTRERALRELARLGELHAEARVLLLGHTHHPLAHTSAAELPAEADLELPAEPLLLNPGAVGQARERQALVRCALLDTGERRVRRFALSYDVERTRAELRRAGLPPDACHETPSLRYLARRAVGKPGRVLRARRRGRAAGSR